MILDIKFDEGVMWISDGRNGYTFMLTEQDLQSRIFHYINEIEMYKEKSMIQMKTEYRVTFTVEVEMPVWAYSENDAERIVEEACALDWEKFKIISLYVEEVGYD